MKTKILLRAVAWWLTLVSLSFLFLASAHADIMDVFELPTCLVGAERLSRRELLAGAWATCVPMMLAAVELWRLRKVGLIGATAALAALVAVGMWQFAYGEGGSLMSVAFMGINASLVLVLARSDAWRVCPKWL